MKIAITGTTSGIGSALAKTLGKDHDIWQINRPELDLLNDSTLDAINLEGYDLLINNAGADYNRGHDYLDWKKTVKINLIVPMYLTQKFTKQNSQGTVINITSTGNHLLPATNSSVFYRSSKIALKHFINEMNETNPRFRMVDIEPGKTQTKFTINAGGEKVRSNKKIYPDDVVRAVKYAMEHPYITHIRIKNTNARS